MQCFVVVLRSVIELVFSGSVVTLVYALAAFDVTALRRANEHQKQMRAATKPLALFGHRFRDCCCCADAAATVPLADVKNKS